MVVDAIHVVEIESSVSAVLRVAVEVFVRLVVLVFFPNPVSTDPVKPANHSCPAKRPNGQHPRR